jgi:hypothetical protein
VRLTDRISVAEEDINNIYDQDKIAIHFPGDGEEDSESINFADYSKKSDAQAIKCFAELNRTGGYIWAEYYTRRTVKVGKVKPSSFKIYLSRWSRERERGKHEKGSIAKLKTLQMEKVRRIEPGQAMNLRAVRPQQGTITKWHKARDNIECLIENKPLREDWSSLFPAQQEAVCAEYLRDPDFEECARLEFLLLPVGRTLKDVDICGMARDGKEIFAQVTNYKKNDPKCRKKIETLKHYKHGRSQLAFFCVCSGVLEEDGIVFVPTERVFSWLKKHEAYYRRLLDK